MLAAVPFASFATRSAAPDPLPAPWPLAAHPLATRHRELCAAFVELTRLVDPKTGTGTSDLAGLADELLSAYRSLAELLAEPTEPGDTETAASDDLAALFDAEAHLSRALIARFGDDAASNETPITHRLLLAAIESGRAGLRTDLQTGLQTGLSIAADGAAKGSGSRSDADADVDDVLHAVRQLDTAAVDALVRALDRAASLPRSERADLACLLFLLLEQRPLRAPTPADREAMLLLVTRLAHFEDLGQDRFFGRFTALASRLAPSSLEIAARARDLRDLPRVTRRRLARQGIEPRVFACDPDPLVARESVSHLSETDLDELLDRDDLHPQVLVECARHSSLTPSRRVALLRHPACPMVLAKQLLPQLDSTELRSVVRTSRHPDIQRRAMLEQIERRSSSRASLKTFPL